MTINVVTEDEANKKVCCRDAVGVLCSASSCMAWRWQPLQTDEPNFLAAIQSYMAKEKCSHQKACAYVHANRKEFNLRSEPYQGFCGLAGTWRTGS